MFSIIRSKLHKLLTQSDTDREADKLIQYTLSLIHNPDLTANARQAYEKARHLSVKDLEIAYIPIYLGLEDIILKHQPPIVKKDYTKDILRDEIKSVIKYQTLHTPLRLIFLKGSTYNISLFRVGIYGLVTNVVEHAGIERLRQIVSQATHGTLLEFVHAETTGIDFNSVHCDEKICTPEAITSAFKTLYKILYEEIMRISGKDAAADVVQKSFDFFRHHYDYDIIAQYLKVLPPELLEHERIAFLSREELQKKAEESVEEKVRREQAEITAQQLENNLKEINDTKLALMNVLDDAKNLENSLTSERDQAQAIISSMAEGLLVVDRDFTITLINEAAARILEIRKEDMLGKNFYEIVQIYKDGSEIPDSERSLEKVLATSTSVNTSVDDDHYYRTENGVRFPVSSTTAPLVSDGKVMGIVKVFHNATTEKESKRIIEEQVKERTRELQEKNIVLEKAQHQISEGWYNLQQEKARLTASVHNLSLGFILTDVGENIMFINPAALKILGLSEAPHSIKDVGNLFGGINHSYLEKCSNEKTVVEVKDFIYKNKFFHIYLTPIFLSAGHEENIGTVILIEDVTEARLVERSKNEFFSIASHELRTPLTAIRGNTSMIMDYYKESLKDPELAEMIGDIHQSSIRLIDIVNDFLDTSRLEMGKKEFKKIKFPVGELVKKVLSEYNVTGSRQKVQLIFEGDEKVEALADPDKTKQIIINLVGNSLKFTEDGSITVRVRDAEGKVYVEVEDTGRGISPINQQLLFKKFQQAETSIYTRDTTKGTGLGLYISRLLVEGMGGNISLIRSEEGKGSVFGFTLPKA